MRAEAAYQRRPSSMSAPVVCVNIPQRTLQLMQLVFMAAAAADYVRTPTALSVDVRTRHVMEAPVCTKAVQEEIATTQRGQG